MHVNVLSLVLPRKIKRTWYGQNGSPPPNSLSAPEQKRANFDEAFKNPTLYLYSGKARRMCVLSSFVGGICQKSQSLAAGTWKLAMTFREWHPKGLRFGSFTREAVFWAHKNDLLWNQIQQIYPETTWKLGRLNSPILRSWSEKLKHPVHPLGNQKLTHQTCNRTISDLHN
jgi:hypothetical protein